MGENLTDLVAPIVQVEKALDNFNLKVAIYRADHGMSPELMKLYKRMGDFHRELIRMEVIAHELQNYLDKIEKE